MCRITVEEVGVGLGTRILSHIQIIEILTGLLTLMEVV